MPTITCSCGKSWSGDDLTACPWERLEIGCRLRCWDCGRALAAAAKAGEGVVATYVDLPARDRGALKKLPECPPLREGPGIAEDLAWD